MPDATSVPEAFDHCARMAGTAAKLAWTNPPWQAGIWAGDLDTCERLWRALAAAQDALVAVVEHRHGTEGRSELARRVAGGVL